MTDAHPTEAEFDPHKLVENDDVRTVNIEGVGAVKYRPLTGIDMITLMSITEKDDTPEMFGFRATWVMMHKAYPDFTYAEWEKYDAKVSGRIISAIVNDSDFLGSSLPEQ